MYTKPIMSSYVVLLRGINVGGKNKISMASLRSSLEEIGCQAVSTYIQSGNVLLQSDLEPAALGAKIESLLPAKFQLDSSIIKVLVLGVERLQAVVDNKPDGFGDHPEKFHSDVIFLMGIEVAEAMPVFSPREGVDTVWAGEGVVYSQRVSALRTKSRLGRIIGTPVYQSMTIRSWNTVTKLLALAQQGLN